VGNILKGHGIEPEPERHGKLPGSSLSGWFYEAWDRCDQAKAAGQPEPFERIRVTAAQCPRIPAEFLAEERAEIGERCYRQEYECSFEEAVGAVFSRDDTYGALSDSVQPLFPEGEEP
jgi:hypothetical protein